MRQLPTAVLHRPYVDMPLHKCFAEAELGVEANRVFSQHVLAAVPLVEGGTAGGTKLEPGVRCGFLLPGDPPHPIRVEEGSDPKLLEQKP